MDLVDLDLLGLAFGSIGGPFLLVYNVAVVLEILLDIIKGVKAPRDVVVRALHKLF